ncbi:MAG TPA: GGDEF domain-containing protein [Burkholderiaceae bacterium]
MAAAVPRTVVSSASPLAIALPLSFLLLQLAVFVLLPRWGESAAYVAMTAAPLLAAVAAVWRGRAEPPPARLGWFVTALALAVWALGALGNLWHEMILGRRDEMYRDAMLAFNLAVVPVTFLLASEWQANGRRLVLAIDALLALTLGYAYFLFTWAMLTARGAPDEAGVRTMLWLMDAQNLVLALGALIRWAAAENERERDLFRALTTYTGGYLLVAFVNNHFIAANPAYGAQESSVVSVVFAAVAWLALRGPAPAERLAGLRQRPRQRRFARAVQSASPLFLAGILLIVALFLIRVDYAAGTAGVLVAVLGYGWRSTVERVRHIEREDVLRRDRSALQAIAWTDALTGVANRRFLDRALHGGDRHASRPLSVLMIDIDHFKALNDRYGHPTGDACLREVAQALRLALVRPGDVLARYGGEEFVALLAEADAAGAQVVAERLRAAVQGLRIANVDSPFAVVTVSVGIASGTLPAGADADALVDAADKALYEAKCGGRNQVRAWAVVG